MNSIMFLLLVLIFIVLPSTEANHYLKRMDSGGHCHHAMLTVTSKVDIKVMGKSRFFQKSRAGCGIPRGIARDSRDSRDRVEFLNFSRLINKYIYISSLGM
ncbi:hypothetical protein C2G38_1433917 [Gigaspora rosea]|uniref:Uncharacterized protein n=1 Tax=Gigaspora rosea TaxID=44941 RepID=A0A397V4R6_9GLOM|nr:hypothetical protein C2G38_1433917 [Gigaspora rosea]